jgi:hypothetical protein
MSWNSSSRKFLIAYKVLSQQLTYASTRCMQLRCLAIFRTLLRTRARTVIPLAPPMKCVNLPTRSSLHSAKISRLREAKHTSLANPTKSEFAVLATSSPIDPSIQRSISTGCTLHHWSEQSAYSTNLLQVREIEDIS